MNDESYLTTADALAYLNTTQRTLYRRLAKGEIPAVRMGHQWRFRKSDLDRWVETQSGGRSEVLDAVAPRASQSLRKPRVLVADDDADVRETLTSILAMSDCEIEAVADGLAAIGSLRARTPDLVITDLRMPGMGGIQVAAEAKRISPAVKVIIVTAYPSQSSAIEAVNIGVDGYVTKPFRPVDVLVAMARVLDLGAMSAPSHRPA